MNKLFIQKYFLQVEGGTRSKKVHYYLPTFDATVESKSMPFSFANNDKTKRPSPDHLCDAPVCRDSRNTHAITLNCFHTFHAACLDDSCCPLCVTPLLDTVQKLANTFNSNLVQSSPGTSNEAEADNESSDPEDEFQDDDQKRTYYLSNEWPCTIQDTVDRMEVKSETKSISKSNSNFLANDSGLAGETSERVKRKVSASIKASRDKLKKDVSFPKAKKLSSLTRAPLTIFLQLFTYSLSPTLTS